MTTKNDRAAAGPKLVEQTHNGAAVERLPSAVGEISALASAHAPLLFFDEVSFCSVDKGVAGVTLTASRQIAFLPNGSVASDRVIVATLRASLPAMLALRATIDEIERMAQRQLDAAAEAAATGADAPTRLPH